MMAGQTINDRLLAARHSLAGQGLAKSVCKATTEELLGPKKKHLDYLVHCTNEPNVSIPQMANLLMERAQSTSWIIVFKALITTHHVICYGNERFTQYLASSNVSFNLANFVDKTSGQSAAGAKTGYDMSPFVRRYSRYLNEKALSYRAVAFDFCKVKRGKEEGTLRTISTDQLLKTLPVLQSQLDALVEFDCHASDLTNGIINMAFMLLFRDLIRLFASYNDGIINLLEKYFEMNKKQCREALDLYKRFLVRMDRVGEFLKVAENIGIDKGDIPDLARAPSSLLEALENHLAALEGVTPTSASAQKTLRTGMNAFATQGDAFSSVDDAKLQRAAMAEEEAALNNYRARVGSPTTTAKNPFLVDDDGGDDDFTTAHQKKTEQILDLFGGEPVVLGSAIQTTTTTTSSALDDLLDLGNPFMDVAAAPVPVDLAVSQQQQQSSSNWPAGGDVTQTQSALFTADFSGVQTMAAPQQPPPQRPAPPAKIITGDLETSLTSLVDSLTMDAGRSNQWNSPKQSQTTRQQPTTVVGNNNNNNNNNWYQTSVSTATTAPMSFPQQQPSSFPMGFTQANGSAVQAATTTTTSANQGPVTFDPFGNM